jgi:hypothetical protein
MTQIVLFNPLMLSDEQFETIAALSALNYTNAQIAVYLEIDYLEFEKALKAENSKLKFNIIRGKLESKFLIHEKLLATAQTGNITAAQEYQKICNAQEVEQVKKRILFYED